VTPILCPGLSQPKFPLLVHTGGVSHVLRVAFGSDQKKTSTIESLRCWGRIKRQLQNFYSHPNQAPGGADELSLCFEAGSLGGRVFLDRRKPRGGLSSARGGDVVDNAVSQES
jgi:hypothetical protein